MNTIENNIAAIKNAVALWKKTKEQEINLSVPTYI